MYYPYMGFPPFMPQTERRGPSIEDLIYARKCLEDLEKSFKEGEDKKKSKKKEPAKFTFLETVGLLLLTAPFIGSAYIYALGYMINNMQDIMKNLISAPH